MRLWHEDLLPYLPKQQLLGQHRECCALRGNGWGRKHSTVDYVFTHPRLWLWAYHRKVIKEMLRRGYKPDLKWMEFGYRGKHCPADCLLGSKEEFDQAIRKTRTGCKVYPEHNDAYLEECLNNLKAKEICIDMDYKGVGIKEILKIS